MCDKLSVIQQKKELRSYIKEFKKSISLDEKVTFSYKIVEKLEKLSQFKDAYTILLYHALPDEVQTEHILNEWAGKKRLILPVVDGDNLILKEYNPDKIVQGYQSILEPEGTAEVSPSEIELAIIPGVAFDAKCNRMGRGKGFYDRLLTDVKCPLIGLGFQFQIVEQIPLEPFDKPLDVVITEEYEYKRNI